MTKPMSKTDFVQVARDQFGMTASTAEEVVTWFFAEISSTLKGGRHVAIKGFGTFKPVHRAGRNATNPRTREPVYIEPKTAVVFKAGRELLAQVQGG